MTACRLRVRLALACLLVLAPTAAGAQDEAPRVVEATLANGLRILLLEDHRSPIIAFQIWYRVGSRNERVGLSGVSHYLEHMMFKGTPSYGPRMYARLVEQQGGQDNAFTSHDATVYFVDIVADKIDLVLTLEADRMQHLTLDPAEVAAERKVIMEERRSRTEDSPIGTLAEAFNAAAFTAHPYRIPVIGFMADIEGVTPAELRAWYNTYYVPNNAIVVVVGDFTAADMLEKIRTRFEPVPRGLDPPAVRIVEPPQRGERRVWVRKEAELPVIFVGYHVPNHSSPDTYPLEVLSAVLSGGRASRLFQRVVHGERVALDAGGDYTRLALDPDTFTFFATALPGKTIDEVERALMAEIERLQRELVTEEELQRAKNQLEASYLFRQDSIHARASTLARNELIKSWRLADEFLPRIRAVTAEDLMRVAQRYFLRDHQTTAILVPAPAAVPAPAR